MESEGGKAKMKVRYYVSQSNPHKFIEVRSYPDGHNRVAGFTLWVDAHHVIKNWLACNRKGNRVLHRANTRSLSMMLDGYTEYNFASVEGKLGEAVRTAVEDKHSITVFYGLE